MKKRKNKKDNFFAANYKICWSYIVESRKFIFAIIGIFFALALIGFLVPVPSQFHDWLVSYIKEIVKETSGLSEINLISFIFFNNAKTSFFGIIFGILLGIFPVLISAFNGYVLGFVSRLSVNADGFLVLWRLLPHGIFELPAVFISMGIGTKLGFVLIKGKKNFKENFYNALRTFIFIVIPLLIIAAIIEGSLIYFFG